MRPIVSKGNGYKSISGPQSHKHPVNIDILPSPERLHLRTILVSSCHIVAALLLDSSFNLRKDHDQISVCSIGHHVSRGRKYR